MVESHGQSDRKSVQIAVSAHQTGAGCAHDIAAQLGPDPYAFVLIFFSPDTACDYLASSLKALMPETAIYGCSTAGELTPDGFADGSVVALGFSSRDFSASSILLPDLSDFSIREGQSKVRQAVKNFQMNRSAPFQHCFALMLVDGLCYREEQIVSTITYGLKDIPLIGGSAGDGLNFQETHLIHDDEVITDAVILLLIESRFPFHIFSCDSFSTTNQKFVVTKADPENRIVYELNAQPAATAYADLLGLRCEDIDQVSFASHPLSVCFGGKCYARSIQDVLPDGAFRFYCAIDEGVVFTLSEIGDMVDGVINTLDDINKEIGPPQIILGFDCVLRRMMAEINQSKGEINRLFSEHKIIGFNTYGEQVHGMHLNLTFSGIAIGQ